MAEILSDTSVPDPPSDELLHKVGLTRPEYEEACKLLKRKPNLVEMGIFGAMWSEHCCYKSSKRHLKKLPVKSSARGAGAVLQGPGENAGVMDLGNDYAVVFKIESHNHPSAVEPFQGAATGVGGIIRDIFAMGARPIGLMDSLRFGNLRPVAPCGTPPGEAVDNGPEDDGEAEAVVFKGPEIPWNNDPKPYVCTLAWLTGMRRQLFNRGPAARGAVKAIRDIHGDMADVLAYCVLPDQIMLVVSITDGQEESAKAVASVLKASIAPLVESEVPPGQEMWEAGFRATQKFDDQEVAEAIKWIEYSPVQRGTVDQIKDYPYVSQVWKHGVAWPTGDEPTAQPVEQPYCAGVTETQAARNRFLLSGVVEGIAHYGNCIGIPTVGGEVCFDPSYSANCLVNAFCVGIVKKDKILKGIASGPGNTALIVGAKTGRDGVQGATFASVDLPEDYAKERPAVQVGDPFMEKLLLEATLEINGKPGLVGVQDFGAAGLTCSGVEMASRAGTGMKLDLDKVPQRAKDLTAYEMMLSESQERMMAVVEKGMEQPFLDVFKKWGLTAVECGEVLAEKDLIVWHDGEQVAKLPNVVLAEEGPDYDRPSEEPVYYKRRQQLADSDIEAVIGRVLSLPLHREVNGKPMPEPANNMEKLLRHLLSDPTIASKHRVYQQYDHMVRTNTVHPPGPSDAAVLRVKETGQGLAIATDCSARHVYLDPKLGAARAVLESARNVIATGGLPIGITNCLNFGNPEKPDRMWQFTQTIAGMRESLEQLDLPVTGGNVSLYNESGGRPILPTPVIGMVGLINKYSDFIPNEVDKAGLEIYVIGSTDGRLDGSSLAFELGRMRAGELAEHDYRQFRACQRFILEARDQGSLTCCHDISDGGLLVALVEMCRTGLTVDLDGLIPETYDNDELNRLAALFGEEGHRWLVAVTKEQRGWLRTAALHYNVPLKQIGETCDGKLHVGQKGDMWFECAIEPLHRLHKFGLGLALDK